MSILEEIQIAAIDSKSDLGEVLRKCKLMAARLGSQPLEDWLIWESNGYPENVPVPAYRVWSLEVKGNFVNLGGNYVRRNVPIPIPLITFLSDDIKESYESYQHRDSVAAILRLLEKTKGNIFVTTGQLAFMIGTKLYKGENCLETWAEFGSVHLVEVINSVRNRVLDFALAIEKEAPNAGERGGSESKALAPARVTQIFKTTVYGGAANIVGTATASTVTFNIGVNDFSALERILIEKGVARTDIAQLEKALESDPVPSTPETFGPKVSSWIGKMVMKAAQGSWQIGAGAAGAILAQLIKAYYGL